MWQLAQIRVPVNRDCALEAPLVIRAAGQPWPTCSLCFHPWTSSSQSQYVTPITLSDSAVAAGSTVPTSTSPLGVSTGTLTDLTSTNLTSVWTYSEVEIGLEPDAVFQQAGGTCGIVVDTESRSCIGKGGTWCAVCSVFFTLIDVVLKARTSCTWMRPAQFPRAIYLQSLTSSFLMLLWCDVMCC